MAVDLYLKVDGVNGESADINHVGWIDIVSCAWGAKQSASMATGSGGGAGKVSFYDLSIITDMDKATPTLLKYCASGKHISQVKVSICKAGGTQQEYATIFLKDVIATSVRFVGNTGNMQTLVYAFQAAIVEHHYWVQGKDGSKGAESQMGWDIKQNIAIA